MTRNDEPEADVALPEPVRDHLGQQLRAAYPVTTEQPQFLGDEAVVPPVFAPQIERLETRLKTHEEGTEAVEHALDKILDAFGVAPPPSALPSKVGQANEPDRAGSVICSQTPG